VEEEFKDAEHARRQRDFAAVAAEEACMPVERERAKRDAGEALTVRDERGVAAAGMGKPECYRGLEKNLKVSYGRLTAPS